MSTVNLLSPEKIVLILSVTFVPGFVLIVLDIYVLSTIVTMMRVLSSIYPIIGASNRRFLPSRERYLVHLNWIVPKTRHCQTLILIWTCTIWFRHSSLPSCDYYSEDAFNDINCTVIAFTETWLKDTNAHAFGVDGYNSVHDCRPDRKGGGVALNVKDCISFSVRKDFFYNNDNVETAFIEVDRGLLGTSNNAIVGVIYLISDILSVIKSEGKSCFLLGDYNINLLNTENHSLTREFVNTMYSFSMFPNVTKPSREKSCTIIYLVMIC